jgi:putative pyruvate formate lyase activating enzyme
MISERYKNCNLCPRRCGVDRTKSVGFCRQSDKIRIARADLHMWEEPCISGKEGSGAVFFSGCTLKCCFCQNFEISQQYKGYEVTEHELADIFLMLQDKGANNINLVSPTQFLPGIITALDIARPKLKIPVVYNCGGYESSETIDMLNGYVDIYLPDLKYFDNKFALKYSGANGYFDIAIEAIKHMQAQVGKPCYDDSGIMKSGVIVRHLTLPSLRHDSEKLIYALRDNFEPDDIVLSLMSQYVPMHRAYEYKEINRRISTFEYNFVVDLAASLGFEGYSQERAAADKGYVPEFFGSKPE